MKMWILAIVIMLTITVNAQHKKEHLEQFTPEQRVELQVKKLTLVLDLTDKQQKEMKTLLLNKEAEKQQTVENIKTRNQNKKLTADERFAIKTKALDNKIAMKAEMKKILTKGQMEKLENMKERKQNITKQNRA